MPVTVGLLVATPPPIDTFETVFAVSAALFVTEPIKLTPDEMYIPYTPPKIKVKNNKTDDNI